VLDGAPNGGFDRLRQRGQSVDEPRHPDFETDRADLPLCRRMADDESLGASERWIGAQALQPACPLVPDSSASITTAAGNREPIASSAA
jgi:hypothetical protein